MRENAEAKARRYLGEARLTVRRITEQSVHATGRGSGAVWDVTWSVGAGWRCRCPARGACAHVRALQSVVVVDWAAK